MDLEQQSSKVFVFSQRIVFEIDISLFHAGVTAYWTPLKKKLNEPCMHWENQMESSLSAGRRALPTCKHVDELLTFP